MSRYFSYFPTIDHDLTNNGQKITLTNILRRFKVRDDIKNKIDVYYEYDIQPGDRPDIIADKYYGNSNDAWVVLLFNDIIDPVFGWPLFDEDFERYIEGKYGSIPLAQAEVHEYRQILNHASVKNDGTRIPKRYVVVDEDTYNTLSPTLKESVSKYDWEVEQNEVKRRIKILDKKYIDQIRDEVKSIIRNG